MKNHTSLLELVIIMSLMVACIPLLLALVRTCNTTGYTYLQDKTLINRVYFDQLVVQDALGVDWYYNEEEDRYYSEDGRISGKVDGQTSSYYTAEGISFLRLNKAACYALPFIQDDYCPDYNKTDSVSSPVMNVYFDGGQNTYPNKKYLDFRDTTCVANPVWGSTNYLHVYRGWKGLRTTATARFVSTNSLVNLPPEREVYMVWDAHNKTWVLTPINWRLSY